MGAAAAMAPPRQDAFDQLTSGALDNLRTARDPRTRDMMAQLFQRDLARTHMGQRNALDRRVVATKFAKRARGKGSGYAPGSSDTGDPTNSLLEALLRQAAMQRYQSEAPLRGSIITGA